MFDEEYLEQHPEERETMNQAMQQALITDEVMPTPTTFETQGRAGFVVDQPAVTLDKLTMEFLNNRLEASKKKLIADIKEELLNLILDETKAGHSVFNSREYPKHQGFTENNPHACLTNEEADAIAKEFLDKGIFVTHNMLNQKVVVFSFNLQKHTDLLTAKIKK